MALFNELCVAAVTAKEGKEEVRSGEVTVLLDILSALSPRRFHCRRMHGDCVGDRCDLDGVSSDRKSPVSRPSGSSGGARLCLFGVENLSSCSLFLLPCWKSMDSS